MKVGNLVKWYTAPERSDGRVGLVGGIVTDTCKIDGVPHATVFWFDLGLENNHPYTNLITISRA